MNKIAGKTKAVAGIDIGGTKIAIGLEPIIGGTAAFGRIATDVAAGPDAVANGIAETIEEMSKAAGCEIVSIGIACPSPLDVENGLVMSPSNLQDWDRFPIVDFFRRRFDATVVLENDANAAALGEFICGAGRGFRNVFYLTASTGIGGAIIVGGEIFRGSGSAGEIGHTIAVPDGIRCNCGSIGCLETICAGVHVARRARERLSEWPESSLRQTEAASGITAFDVAEAARRSDPLAVEIWEETCRFLAIGIGNAITLLGPEAVIVGGGMAAAGELLFAPLRRLVPKNVSMVPSSRIKIMPATLGAENGVRGAFILAKRAYEKEILQLCGRKTAAC